MTISKQSIEALADYYELFSAAFDFPTIGFARALASGAFKADYDDIAAELGIASNFDDDGLRGLDSGELLSGLKREYSWLYLSPGRLRKIYPYESAFQFHQSGERGMPTMMVTKTAVGVEMYMRRAGVLPDDFAQEPVDRIDKELAVMKFALTNQLAALGRNETEVAKDWALLAHEFKTRHLDAWVVEFMQCTASVARDELYVCLAQAFLDIYATVDQDHFDTEAELMPQGMEAR